MQLIAMLTMLIDHLGYVFFPDERWMRIVGRIAFPIYCYLLVAGYRRTRSKKRYAIRLFVLALLSQIPFMFAFVTDGVNVIGTLFVALIVMMIIDRFEGRIGLQVLIGALLVLAVQVPLEALNFDYAVYGVLTVLVYRYLPSALGMLAGQFVLNILFIFVFHFSNPIQLYSLITTVFIAGLRLASPETRTEIRLPRWLWRAFYPVHLAMIALAEWWYYGDAYAGYIEWLF
ncbi:conjugal transfer protein TraX [Saccharibacillus sp. O23]|uniref:TraX family protein n=1 Tax=Saccharibacillus sp. O23 TaxID=2009338 RepID=UPI000B4E50CC|nr:TraX family protein [Saccharibacillus sp. O23]OWR30511.1 conjugal transfer protein TraX [Saccharibacillus sp. O23]